MSKCGVAGCSRADIKARGFCDPHYQRAKRIGRGGTKATMDQFVRGTSEHQRVLAAKICSSPSCNAPAKSRGLCQGHYLRLRLGHETDSPLRRFKRYASGDQCRVTVCDDPPLCQRLCTKHYAKLKTYGEAGIAALEQWIKFGCAVCGDKSGLPHIDHDHSCCRVDPQHKKRKTCGNCVRGALCYRCNMALGLLQDSVANLNQMIRYLIRGTVIEQRRVS